MRKGQAMVEYLLAVAGVILLSGVLWFFISAAHEQSHRAAELARSERM